MKTILTAIILSSMIILAGCGISKEAVSSIKSETGIELSGKSKISEHSINTVGLNGDGCEIYIIRLSDEDAEKTMNLIKSSSCGWTHGSFSAKEADKSLSEKTGTKIRFVEGHLNGENGTKSLYEGIMFLDRTPAEASKNTNGDILNYTFCTYDKETGTLLIYRFDS